jgi:hypothetical protein
MTTPTATFLTIAEAVQKTGRSPSTVRRLIKQIAEAAAHPDRGAIEPSVKQVDVFKKKGENFTWKIREDVLMKNFERAQLQEQKFKTGPNTDVLQILRRELELKNTQIEKQFEVIQSLNERLREGNILMGSLQQRLALPEAQSPAASTVDVASKQPSTEAEQAPSVKPAHQTTSTPSTKASKKPAQHSPAGDVGDSVKTPKKGILRWLLN